MVDWAGDAEDLSVPPTDEMRGVWVGSGQSRSRPTCAQTTVNSWTMPSVKWGGPSPEGPSPPGASQPRRDGPVAGAAPSRRARFRLGTVPSVAEPMGPNLRGPNLLRPPRRPSSARSPPASCPAERSKSDVSARSQVDDGVAGRQGRANVTPTSVDHRLGLFLGKGEQFLDGHRHVVVDAEQDELVRLLADVLRR